MTQPFLLPWVRVLLLIRSITSTTWVHEAWPEVKLLLRRTRGRRLRAALAAVLVPNHAPEFHWQRNSIRAPRLEAVVILPATRRR